MLSVCTQIFHRISIFMGVLSMFYSLSIDSPMNISRKKEWQRKKNFLCTYLELFFPSIFSLIISRTFMPLCLLNVAVCKVCVCTMWMYWMMMMIFFACHNSLSLIKIADSHVFIEPFDVLFVAGLCKHYERWKWVKERVNCANVRHSDSTNE